MNKNVLCNKRKNDSVIFFICCMSSMCVQLFTAFEEAVLKLYVPWHPSLLISIKMASDTFEMRLI